MNKGITFLEKTIKFFSDIIFFIFSFFITKFRIKKIGIKPSKNLKKYTILISNGPSLNESIKWIKSYKNCSEIYVTHYFGLSEYFFILKPDYYFFADPVFWSNDANENFKEDNNELFDILSKVNWEMKVIVTQSGFEILKKKIKNKYINIQNIGYWPINFRSELLTIFSLRMKIITPIFSTVTVMSLWHAILRERKKIYLFGADFSTFKEYSVDQKNNALNNEFSHFYKNTKAQDNALEKYTKNKKQIHRGLYLCSLSFYQMYLLSEVAIRKNIKIFNGSKSSYLTCFKRINLSE